MNLRALDSTGAGTAMMFSDQMRAREYCQVCGKELPGVATTVDVGPALCSECQITAYVAPSYLQATLDKPPFAMLLDESKYQYSWLGVHRPDVVLDMSRMWSYEPTVLGSLPDTSLATAFSDVGILQQNVLHPETLEAASINSIAHTITEANLKIADTLSSVIKPDNHFERLTTPSYAGWLNPDSIVDKSLLSSGVASRATSVLAISLAADNAFLSFDPSRLYDVPGVHANVAELSVNSLDDLAGEYKSLWTDSYGNYGSVIGLPSLVIERPPFEIYQAGMLAELVAPFEEHEPEEKPARRPMVIRLPTDTRDKILTLGRPFLEMYDGAAEAVNSSLADSQRHACVSLRELVTHTIHRLAPDEEVVEYLGTRGDAREYLHEGRPTRKGRISYICREIEMGSFAEFVDADARSTLAFMDLLQEGTHSVEAHFSEAQLAALLSRAGGLLSFLIDISNG